MLLGEENLIKRFRKKKGMDKDTSLNVSKYPRFRYNKLLWFRTGIEDEFLLPNRQKATLKDSLKLKVEKRLR